MRDYLVIDISIDTQNTLQHRLDIFAQDGWRVVCDSKAGLILERERTVVVTYTDNGETIVRSLFPPTA